MSSKEIKLADYFFEKSSVIGAGNFGTVYYGKDKNTKTDVCVKVFSKKEEFGQQVLETIKQKELNLTKLMIKEEHQNLVRILDVYDDETLEEAYIVMELCDTSLTDYCKKKTSKFNSQGIIDFIYQVTNGYYHLEEHNIIHRDMKPDNILIKFHQDRVIYKVKIFNIQLADFGLGKFLDNQNKETKTKNIGSPYYFAPEIMNSAQQYTNKCDIFSFGIIIFEVLFGNMTFKSSQNRNRLQSQSFEQLFGEQLKNVDEWIKKLLSLMIIYDQNMRIGWKELKVIMDLNMIDQYKKSLGRIVDDNIFLGSIQNEKNKLTVKVFEKDDGKGNIKELQFIQPYSPVDTTNVIKIDNVINKDHEPLVYVVMEGCDCNLQTLMESQQFSSDEILNFIEQIANGQSAISLSQKKMYSISLQNILVKFDGNKKIYKISDYEFYQIKEKKSNQFIVQPVGTVSQLAWIIYQLILRKKILYQDFQKDLEQQAKIDAVLVNLNYNAKTVVQQILVPEQKCSTTWDQLLNNNKQDLKPKVSNIAPPVAGRFATINSQPQPLFYPQVNLGQQNKPQFSNNPQFPQFANQNANMNKPQQFKPNAQVPPPIQQAPQINFQPQQIQPVFLNPNFNPPQNQFIPPNLTPNQQPQNQQQMNFNFGNPAVQNNNAQQLQGRYGTTRPPPPLPQQFNQQNNQNNPRVFAPNQFNQQQQSQNFGKPSQK